MTFQLSVHSYVPSSCAIKQGLRVLPGDFSRNLGFRTHKRQLSLSAGSFCILRSNLVTERVLYKYIQQNFFSETFQIRIRVDISPGRRTHVSVVEPEPDRRPDLHRHHPQRAVLGHVQRARQHRAVLATVAARSTMCTLTTQLRCAGSGCLPTQ